MINNTYLVPAFLSAAAFSVQAYPLNLFREIPSQSENYIKLLKIVLFILFLLFKHLLQCKCIPEKSVPKK